MMAKATTSDEVVKTNKPGKAAAAPKPGFFARIGNYFRDVRSEMKRVVWPSRSEVINSSVVVIVTLIFFSVFILAVDLVVQQVVTALGSIRIGG
ncbi:MAG: preprotein translocase subunit SecE [Coriobacteriia bacterium]|nr:preprotein translocase subunit SecE [Coriobacteriia bacterium]